MAPLFTSEFMTLTEVSVAGARTRRFTVSSARGAVLGEIKWYGAWRQYCFWPAPRTIFNKGCLTDLHGWLTQLTGEHRRG
jgi:hypothetical protein